MLWKVKKESWKVENRKSGFVVTNEDGAELEPTDDKIAARSAMRVLNEQNISSDSETFEEFSIKMVEGIVEEEKEKMYESV